jgi:hypothetical protein
MNQREHDERKDALFDAWVADLRADRPPGRSEDAALLPPNEVAETLHLARWWAGMQATDDVPFDVEGFARRLKSKLEREAENELILAIAALKAANSIGEALNTVAARRRMDRSAFERAIGLLPGVWNNLVLGKTPLHRIPFTTAARLLGTLQLSSENAVSLVRRSSTEWARVTFGQPSSALGRTGPDEGVESRGELLREAAQGGESELAKELEAIERFIASLRDELAK